MYDQDLTQFLEELNTWKSANDTSLEKISALREHAEEILGQKGRKIELEDTLRGELRSLKNILEDLHDVNEGLEQRNKILEKEVKDLTYENARLKEKMGNEIDQKNEELKVQYQRSEDQMQALRETFTAEVDSRISYLENKLEITTKENCRLLRAKDDEINDLVENISKLRDKALQFKTSRNYEMYQRISMSIRNEYESKLQALSKENEKLKEEVLKGNVTYHGSESQSKNETVSKSPSTSGHDSTSGQKPSFKRKFYNPDESLLKPVNN